MSINTSQYGFVCPVKFSNEKYIRIKKKKFLDIFLRKNRYQVFVNYSQILPIWQILFWIFLNSQFIPISIRTEVGSAILFLFLFAGKITNRWSLKVGHITLGGPQMPLNWSELGVNITMFFSKTYCLDFLYRDGLENLKCVMEKHLMPTQPLPTHLVMQVWHGVLLSVFVRWVSGARRLSDLQLHGWTHLCDMCSLKW